MYSAAQNVSTIAIAKDISHILCRVVVHFSGFRSFKRRSDNVSSVYVVRSAAEGSGMPAFASKGPLK